MISQAKRDRSRELRVNATPFEQTFWQTVRGHRFAGFKFRRQQVIGPFIVDFVCLSEKLIVELDGSQHAETVAYDTQRDAWLNSEGYRVFRVWNNEWTQQQEAVLERLWEMLNSATPSPQPLPPDGGGAKTTTTLTPLSLQGRGAGGEGAAADAADKAQTTEKAE
jgi:very-short-patch-repair endonuclease